MRKICDLYLCKETRASGLRLIGLFDSEFSYRDDVVYFGYLNVNIDRIKLVAIVSDLRRNGVCCFSVPVEYRTERLLNVGDALILARDCAESRGLSVSGNARVEGAPLFWIFDLVGGENKESGAGGCIMIDKIDGHVWTAEEYEEYMYDYNNII